MAQSESTAPTNPYDCDERKIHFATGVEYVRADRYDALVADLEQIRDAEYDHYSWASAIDAAEHHQRMIARLQGIARRALKEAATGCS